MPPEKAVYQFYVPTAVAKNPLASAGDTGSIPGSGRSPGNGNPLQYSRLENSMDRGAWPLSMGSQSMRSRVRDFILEESRFCFHPLQLTFPV